MQRVWLVAAMCLPLCACNGASTTPATSMPATSFAAPRPSYPADGTILSVATGRPLAHVAVDGPITAAVSDGNGGWYIGGGFSTVDGRHRPTLAHIRANGSLVPTWRPRPLRPPRMLPFVSLARAGRRVFVAGGFQVPPHGRLGGAMALTDSDGRIVRTWQSPNSCGDWEIRTDGGRVWIATGCAAGICLLEARTSTGAQLDWNPSIAAIGEIACLNDMAFANSDVYFTGGFGAVGGERRNGIAAASIASGALDTAFAPSGGCATDGHALALNAHLVYVGGDSCPVAALDETTGRQVWAWPRKGNNTTGALIATPTRVYVGGSFPLPLAGVQANGLVALNARTGVAEPSWHPPAGSDVFALVLSGNRILVGAN